MFKKLRMKFIAITMAMVAIVMAFALTVVCVVEYQRSYSIVETALDNAVQAAIRDHGINHDQKPQHNPNPNGQAPAPTQERSQESDQDATPPAIGRRGGELRASSSLIPVAAYRISDDGSTSVVPQVTSASISKDLLNEALPEVGESADGYGTLTNLGLHYYKVTIDSESYVAFTDMSYTSEWKSLALVLAATGAGTLVLFLVVALFYSQWALRPVKEAWDSQRQFVADASHDLKTPITVILANAAILLKHPDHTIASESQWIESTQKEAEEMQELVNEMLELAHIEGARKADIAHEPVDLSDLVDGETLLFDSIALERNCSFNCSIDGGVSVLGDEKQLKKMVSTLVENAFKYVEEGGTVDVALRKSGKMATISIRNTGSGISSDDLPHIFDRFYRTDKARTSGTGGFGLGLAIAREIARQHDGDITCKSSDAEGTTFTVALPTAQ